MPEKHKNGRLRGRWAGAAVAFRRFGAIFGAAGCVGAWMGGCASEKSVARVEVNAAPRWEAVLMPEETAAGVEEIGDEWAWWDWRRDSAMAVRTEGPLLATDEWPEPARPTMDHSRYTTLPTRAETILYFRP